MSVQNKGRRKRVARLRSRLRPEYLMLFLVGAGFLGFQSWSRHRLDTLRHQRVELEESLLIQRGRLAQERMRFDRESAQFRIVERAREELGLMDCGVGERIRLALPTSGAPDDAPLLARLAHGLDRFGDVRTAAAAEERP